MTALKCPEGPALLAETEELRWLYKPPGLPVFPPHGDPEGPSLYAALPQLVAEPLPSFPQGFEGGLAHRLDTSTSGLVLAARTPEALARLPGPVLRRPLGETLRLHRPQRRALA
ncbi:MAG: hypothetical protein IPN01_11845 [Deltaproteobacteria bacterium]|nr:hypothetical protein [Deltaproteobacteria bacterium]